MDILIQDAPKIIATLGNLVKRDGLIPEFAILSNGECSIQQTGYDNWDGGVNIYSIYCRMPIDIYAKYESVLKDIEQNIKNKAENIFRAYPSCWIGDVLISPKLSTEIEEKSYKISSEELLKLIDLQKSLMISVSTGGERIQNVNDTYKERLNTISEGLAERNIRNTILFNDLWEWYEKWRSEELSSYQSRRVFLNKLFLPLEEAVKKDSSNPVNPIFDEPTGWERVDRSINEIKNRIKGANTEEQFQSIGLLGRETLISLAQVVYIESEHHSLDGVAPSKTDAKRMLEAYISHSLPGKTNENIRKHAKASLDLANDLTHRRTAEYRLAALSAEATNAVVNIIAIISGRRDLK
ncbi:MAG: hypothetical protein Q8L15_14365 [Methylobacter sp.]|nr:hypothetical protein [Methylobacter sp.]